MYNFLDFLTCYLFIGPLPEHGQSEDSSDRRSEVACD